MWRSTSIAFLICAGASVAAAQSSSPASPAGTTQAPTDQATTLTGCVRTGDAQNTFVLSVVGDPAAGSTASASGDRSTPASPHATGTTGAAAKAITTTTYVLAPSAADVDLGQYVGKRVTVGGTLDQASKKTVASADTAAATRPDATPRDGATPVVSTTEATRVQAQRMHVTSIQPAGGSCQ